MNEFDDNLLDARLQDVEVPGDLALRIREGLLPSDALVDQALARCQPPAGLLAALKRIPADELLDDQLRDVPVPASLASRLHRRVRLLERLPIARIAHLAVAAGLFLCLTAGWWWAVIAAFTPTLETAPDTQFAWLPYHGPQTVDGEWSPPEVEIAQLPAFAADPPYIPVVSAPEIASALDLGEEPAPPGPVGQFRAELARGLASWEDVVLLRWGVLGSPRMAYDVLPDLEHLPLAPPRGVEPPPVRGYDRRFLLRHGFFPPIPPSAHADLQTIAAPLVVSTPGRFEVEALLSSKRKLEPWQVRVEDFLAGIATEPLSAPAGGLALSLQGAHSPFGSPEARLLEFTIAAGSQKAPHPACHLVLAIDLSASMERAGRRQAVRIGLERTLAQMSPADRVSLVVFAEEILCRVEQAGWDDRHELLARFDELRPQGGTDLARGVQQAAALALEDGSLRQKRLVVLTDSQSHLPDDTAARLREIAALTAESAVQWSLIDLSGASQPDPLLAEIARDTGGDVRQTAEPRQVYGCLLEQLSGSPALVASEALLRVQFNPRQVLAYRLLGHEPSLQGQPAPADLDVSLAAGDSARVLIEVWLAPPASSDKSSLATAPLATASLAWKDPVSGAQRSLRRSAARDLVLSDFPHAPPALQAAALAAEAAELLRGSREALRQWQLAGQPLVSWQTWDDAVRRLAPEVQSRPDIRRLRSLVQTLRERN